MAKLYSYSNSVVHMTEQLDANKTVKSAGGNAMQALL